MEMETPDTGTDLGTIGSLEIYHEEAQEISRSMEMSIAFWGPDRNQSDMIPATNLKCAMEKSIRALEAAHLLWGKMGQGELERVKQVERILLKDGEISTETLYDSLKTIVEGVGLTLDGVLSGIETDDSVKAITSIMSEILYIYNQNEPPEITETEDYGQTFEEYEGTCENAADEEEPTDDGYHEESYIVQRIEFLLEKSKELDLGEIKIPTSPQLSARSKLSIVEKQLHARLRLKHIRKSIETKTNRGSAGKGDVIPEGRKSREKPSSPAVDKEKDQRKENAIKMRPVFRTAVKPQTLEYDALIKQAPSLQERLRKANLIRKKLAEEKQKEKHANQETTDQVENKLQKRKTISSNAIAKKCGKREELFQGHKSAGIHSYTVNKLKSTNRNKARKSNVRYPIRKIGLVTDRCFNREEELEHPVEGCHQLLQTQFNNMKYYSQENQEDSKDIISSIRNSAIEEHDEEGEVFHEEEQYDTWENRLPENPISTNQNFQIDSEAYSGMHEIEKDANDETRKPGSARKSSGEDRPCSRDEMLSEMKKLLKEALKEVANPKSVYQCARFNSLEFTGEGEGSPMMHEVSIENRVMSAQCQTTDSIDDIHASKCQPSCTCCDKAKEETKVDIASRVKSDEDVVDIKVTQESLSNTWTSSTDQDTKLSTEISVSQNGSGPAVKVSVISRLKGQDAEPALTQRRADELEAQGNVKEAINVLKDFIRVTVNDDQNADNENRNILDSCDKIEPIVTGQTVLSPQVTPTDEPPLPYLQSNTLLRPQTCLSTDCDILPPMNVNLAMLLQECSCFTPREEFRPCGPFQIGGVHLTEIGPSTMDEDIGDGIDIQYPNPWSETWAQEVWRDNFSTNADQRETDSLYVNTSDDALDNTEENSTHQSLNTSIPEVTESQMSLIERIYSRTGKIATGFIGILLFPFVFGFSLFKSSLNKIFWRKATVPIAENESEAETKSPT